MIRKINVEHIAKIMSAANTSTLINVAIYKANKGKNSGSLMIDYNIDAKAINHNPVKDEVFAEFIRSMRQIKQHIVNNDYKTIDFSYNVSTKKLQYRFVGTE